MLSDLEVDREERQGKMYTLIYKLEDGSGEMMVATVRPETIFADQAVAVHPDDARFSSLVGKMVRIPLTNRFVPIIADESVEMDFGTGCLKITPAHDPTDFEIGKRHNLGMPSVIDKSAKLYGDLVPEAYRGLDRFAARKLVVKDLEAQELMFEAKDYKVVFGHFRAHQRTCRTARDDAVVVQHARTSPKGAGIASQGRDETRAGTPCQSQSRLAREHPRMGNRAATLVGTSTASLVRRRRQDLRA